MTVQQLGRRGSSSVEVAISARHGVLHDPDHEYIDKKLPRLSHLFGRLHSVKVTVDFQKSNPKVEVLVSAEHKHDFVAAESAPHVKEAFDLALDKMEAQLRKYKEKIQEHRGRGTPPKEDGQDSAGKSA